MKMLAQAVIAMICMLTIYGFSTREDTEDMLIYLLTTIVTNGPIIYLIWSAYL